MLIIRKPNDKRVSLNTNANEKHGLIIDENNVLKISDFTILSPGEYEKNKVFVQYIKYGLYWITLGNFVVLFLGKDCNVSDKDLAEIDNIDIFLAFSPKQNQINLIEPRIIIALDKLNIKDRIKISKKDLPEKGSAILWNSKKD